MTDYIVEIISDDPRVIDIVGGEVPEVSINSGDYVIDVIGPPAQVPYTGQLEDLVLSYAASGQLITVERVSTGLQTNLAYTGTLLTGVTDYRGTRSLNYTNDQLTSVTWD